MNTFLIMLFKPLAVLGMAAGLAKARNAITSRMRDGKLKRTLLMHLWETDWEKDARLTKEKQRAERR